MAILYLAASGASVSTGAAGMPAILMGLAAGGASVSAGAANLVVITDLQVTQAGLLADGSGVMLRATQAGLGVEGSGTERQLTMVGLQVDGKTQVRRHLTQAGLGVEGSGAEGRLTMAGLQVDARHTRPQTTTNCWEFHVTDRAGTYLVFLDGAFEKAYRAVLNDCGGGSFKIHANDDKATAANLAIGNRVLVRYRNVDVGAFLIEEVEEPLVAQEEEAGLVWTVSGRGLLSLLEDGLVYPSDLNDAQTVERTWVGATRASILLDLYNEFMARGGGDLTPDFSATVDSGGLAWTDSQEIGFKAGQTLLDVARTLTGLGLDITVDADRTLRAWLSAGVDRSETVFLRHGLNILACSRNRSGREMANAILGEGQDVLAETTDATSIAAHGRREAYLPARNTGSASQVATANTLLLNQYAEERRALRIEVNTAAYFPLLSYQVGDVVRVEIPGQETADYRILAISIRESSGPCDLQVELEINSLQLEYFIRLAKAFEANRQNAPVGGGTSAHLATSDTRAQAASGHTHVEADVTDLEHDATKLQGRALASTAPSDGQAVVWNAGSAQWEPQDQSGGSVPNWVTNALETPPTTPDASYDDEFDDESLDVAWTVVNDPVTAPVSETRVKGFLTWGMTELGGSDTFDQLVRIFRTPPIGTEAWEFIAKIAVSTYQPSGERGEWAQTALSIFDSTGKIGIGVGLEINYASVPLQCQVKAFLATSSAIGGLGSTDQMLITPSEFVWVKMTKTTTAVYTSSNTYEFFVSVNGVIWHQLYSGAYTFANACDGIGFYGRGPKAQSGDPVSWHSVASFRRCS